jgi:transaldolase
LKIFVDTADIEDIKLAASWGILDGVTTNPSLVAKTGRPFKDCIVDICKAVPGPVSAEAVSLDTEGLLKEARELSSWAQNVVVKIPMTKEGIQAVKVLSGEGINTNVTLCFSSNQCLLAAKAGATYCSIFIGRLDDAGHDGMQVVAEAAEILSIYDFDTEIIAASIRHPLHVPQCALAGADVATIPFAVIDKMFRHPLTDDGIERFLADWEKVKDRKS